MDYLIYSKKCKKKKYVIDAYQDINIIIALIVYMYFSSFVDDGFELTASILNM